MADISKEELEKEIAKILENANLAETSTKTVIQALEKVFDCNLKDRKKDIDELVMNFVNSKSSEDEQEEEEEEEEEEEIEEVKEPKKAAPKRKRGKKKGSDDSDDDWKKKEAPAKKAKGGGKKGSGYTRAYKLSPQLAELMGKEEMPRHEVVKQVWAIIKQKNLYDPNNKQFAICDDALYKVIGTKRFRTFGMMKYLKTHFICD